MWAVVFLQGRPNGHPSLMMCCGHAEGVYKVLILQTVLHCNMLFPRNYHHETESNIDNTGKFDSNGTPEQFQDDVQMSDLEDHPVYEGPQTQSHRKALMKANLIMNDYFQIDDTSSPATPIARRELRSSLVG